MKWIKRGHIFTSDSKFSWSKSYAQIPRPLVLSDRIRIFYATRYYDEYDLPISQTSFIDVDKTDLSRILYIHDKPSLDLGKIGDFSHFGIHPTMLIKKGSKVFFFYQGWNRCIKVPYETNVGLAISSNNGLTFNKTSTIPVFGKSKEDPFYVNGVFIYENDLKYIMWYSSGKEWIESDGRMESVYTIKRATSDDLISWKRNNLECIPTKLALECQNSATVIKIGDNYHMWFCYRHALDFRNSNKGYRIGYAWSKNLMDWNRNDSLAGIDISYSENWDSQMICYPYVFKIDNRIILLYSGNYFGKDGFGYAELELETNK